jgi:fructose-specific phosphotransferase system component IIB
MKLAIVTACPNGMVTSVLCARLLDAAAQRQAGAPAWKWWT